MTSLTRLMKITISIPDYSSISKRSISLPRHVLSQAMEPGSLVIVDSTGLKVYGKDEWHQEKHDVPARRTWRKLHLAVDEQHQIVACELTTPEVGDPSAVPDLLTQIVTPFKTFMGDGAYDGEPVSQAVLTHQPNAQVVIPPHKTAVLSAGDDALAAVAQCIGESIRRPGDSASRYGGEEFAVVLPNTDHRGAVQVAEKIRAAVQALGLTHMTSMHQVVTVSIGVACMTEHRFATLRVFVNAADGALYDAKSAGRNRVACESDSAEAHAAAPRTNRTINT